MIQLSADTVWKCFSNVTLQTICSVSSIACIVQNVFLYFPPSPSWLKEKGRGCWWCAILLSPGCGWRTSVCVPSSLAIKMCGGQHVACLPCLVSHDMRCIVDNGIPHSQLIFWVILGKCAFVVCVAFKLFLFCFNIFWQNIKRSFCVHKYCGISFPFPALWGEKIFGTNPAMYRLLPHQIACFDFHMCSEWIGWIPNKLF